MIFKIRKMFRTDGSNDYSLLTPIGDTVCKIARIKNGFYFYNTHSEQIAQLTFDKSQACLAIGQHTSHMPSIVVVTAGPNGKLSFQRMGESTDGLTNDIRTLEICNAGEITVFGNLNNYSFDIYEGSSLSANVVPVANDPNYYMLKLDTKANALLMVMLVLAIELMTNV
ncbi:MAG: hypothetical protein LBU04_00560 [Christensenellaceae bacterium]|jgi:hypothetical protein|nr:hypothetical protein [Christensenellaceae bacterium]